MSLILVIKTTWKIWLKGWDDENYARAKEELRELEREESRRLRHLAKFKSESHKVVNELEEVVAGRNELASEREELKIIHRTLRFEFNKRKETEKVERAVEKLERDRNKLEWECEDLENKDELDTLESIDLAFKQKKIENLNEMENVLNRFKYVRAELEADLEELEEKPEQEKLEFDFMEFWRARQNFDFEGIENLLDLHRKITDAAREALNLEADELEDTQSKLEDIQSDFEIDDVLEYHEDEHHTLEGDELNQIHEALDRTYFNKTGSYGIENEIDRFKHERKEFKLELGSLKIN